METILTFLNLTNLDAEMIPVGVVLFTIFVFSLGRFVVAPFVALVEAREEATEGAERSAQSNIDEAEIIERNYESQIIEERIASEKAKAQQIAKAKTEAARIIERAESQAREQARRSKEELEEYVSGLRKAAMQEAANLSRLMVEKAKSTAASSTQPG